jgi:hypothetical protein
MPPESRRLRPVSVTGVDRERGGREQKTARLVPGGIELSFAHPPATEDVGSIGTSGRQRKLIFHKPPGTGPTKSGIGVGVIGMPDASWFQRHAAARARRAVPAGRTAASAGIRPAVAHRLHLTTLQHPVAWAGIPVPPAIIRLQCIHRKDCAMLWTIFVVLLVLWLLGMVSSYTMGGFIHILLLLAIAVVLIRVIQGRRPV